MIYQQQKLPSPTELSDDPELAVLVTLTTALQMASFALLSVFPELDSPLDGPDPHAPHGVQEAFATSIVKQIDALEDVVEEYLRAVERHRSWQNLHQPSF
jgi:hypothetical protein